MATKAKKPASKEMESLLEPIRVAIALGAEVPPLVGSYFFELVRTQMADDVPSEWSMGCFESYDAAAIALVNWIVHSSGLYPGEDGTVDELVEELNLTLETDDFFSPTHNDIQQLWKAFLDNRGVQGVIDWYCQQMGEGYEITRRTVRKTPKLVFES